MPRSERFASLSAIAGAVLGLLLTPPMAAVWDYNPPATPWASKSLVVRNFGPTLESLGALSFADALENGAYEVYGKGFFLVYLAMVPIVRLMHQRYLQRGDSRWELWTWRVMWASLLVAAAGDFASYWGVSVPGPVGEALWGGGFGVELLAAALLLISTTVYGAVSLRLKVLPVWASILLIAVIPLAIVTLGNVVDYIPNGFAVPLSIIWALIGVWLLLHPQEAVAHA